MRAKDFIDRLFESRVSDVEGLTGYMPKFTSEIGVTAPLGQSGLFSEWLQKIAKSLPSSDQNNFRIVIKNSPEQAVQTLIHYHGLILVYFNGTNVPTVYRRQGEPAPKAFANWLESNFGVDPSTPCVWAKSVRQGYSPEVQSTFGEIVYGMDKDSVEAPPDFSQPPAQPAPKAQAPAAPQPNAPSTPVADWDSSKRRKYDPDFDGRYESLVLLDLLAGPLVEDRSALTYDQLFQLSDPKRIVRSNQVRGPALEMTPDAAGNFYNFNFKSYPSTTGLRHHGYIRLQKTDNPNLPADQIPVEVDCSCPDFKYRFAWANKQHGASHVGPSSLNQAWNKASRITNPAGTPGLCKHALAARNFLYNLLPNAAEETAGDASQTLDQATAQARQQAIGYDGRVLQGKARQAKDRQVQIARNIAGPMPATDVPQPPEDEVPSMDDGKPVPLPSGAEAPAEPVSQPVNLTQPNPTTATAPISTAAPRQPDENEIQTRQESRVIKATTDNMKKNNDLSKALSVLEELEDNFAATAPEADGAATPGEPEGAPEVGDLGDEPPVDAGAPEDEALQLLQQIAAGVTRLADEIAPAPGVEDEPEAKLDIEVEPKPEEKEEEDEDRIPSPEDEEDYEDIPDKMPVGTGA